MDKSASLTANELAIINDKETEQPYSGEYDDFTGVGTYLCRRCGLALFRSTSKFHSGCGWPSFEDNIVNAVKHIPDQDNKRTEILCARCDAHLGHVFHGEGFTDKNTRHCVNSRSLDFVNDSTVLDTEEAIFAAGCFWGVEYLFQSLPGVVKTVVGYTGGQLAYPTYEAVCSGTTGHYEAIRVVYDIHKIDYKTIAQYFFEIHDPTQQDGQGPDHGQQYLSVAFYYHDAQKHILEKLAHTLEAKGHHLATRILPVSVFWRAERYHQQYYVKQSKQPYCHHYTKRF